MTPAPRGLLAVLRAFVADERALPIEALQPLAVKHVVDCGFGPVLARVTANTPGLDTTIADQVVAADLTARVLTGAVMETVTEVLVAAHRGDCAPVLLKGCATAVRYYPEPHLRTMGDIDLLIEPERSDAFAAVLQRRGFTQRRPSGMVDYQRHHHTMPYWHSERQVWIEVHTRPFPARSPLAGDARFALSRLQPLLSSLPVAGIDARVMNHELQLVYTAARWAESFNCERGAWPLLDVALLLRSAGGVLDWSRIRALAEHSWAGDALAMLLEFLHRFSLVSIPDSAWRALGRNGISSRLRARLLRRLVVRYVIDRRPAGRVLTQRNLRTIWDTAMQPAPVWRKLVSLPVRIAFPPDGTHDRSKVGHTLRRAASAMRGEKGDQER